MDGRDEELEGFAYDPKQGPDREEWLELDEFERDYAIRLSHERMMEPHPETPNVDVHVHIHAIVENQIALGDPPAARATLERLVAEGLDRHEAVHAVGSILANFLFDVLKGREEPFDPAAYAQGLEALTAESWRAGAEVRLRKGRSPKGGGKWRPRKRGQ